MCMQVRIFLVTTMRSFWIVQLIFGASHSKFSTFFGFPSSFFFRHFKLKGPHAIGMYGRTSRPCTFEATFSRDLRDFAKDFSRQHLASSSQGRKKSFFLKWHLQKRCKLFWDKHYVPFVIFHFKRLLWGLKSFEISKAENEDIWEHHCIEFCITKRLWCWMVGGGVVLGFGRSNFYAHSTKPFGFSSTHSSWGDVREIGCTVSPIRFW